jgi:hypothetical protein
LWGVKVVAAVLAILGILMLFASLAGLGLLIYALDHPPLVETSLAVNLAAAGLAALIPLTGWAVLAALLRTQTQNEAMLRALGNAQVLDVNQRMSLAGTHRPAAPGDPMVQVRPMPATPIMRPVDIADTAAPVRLHHPEPRTEPEGALVLARPVDPNLIRLWEQATADKPISTERQDITADTPAPEVTADHHPQPLAEETS